MAYARTIAQAFRRRGLDPAAALEAAQITPPVFQDPGACISARQMELLSGAAMQALDDEALGAFSRRLPWGSYGMLARASITAPELGLALRRWCRHHALLTDDLRLHLELAGESARLDIEEGPAHRCLAPDARELSLVHLLRNVHGLACWFIDSRIPLQAVDLPFAAPAHDAAFAHMFPGPVHFGAPRAGLRFDARYLDLPLRRDEAALSQMLQRALPLTVLQYRRDRLLVQQVRQVLRAGGEAARSAGGIARALNLSARTLHRQLREEGALLQQLRDEVRCEQARELLWRSDRPVKQVAAAVGFRNEKSFIRAFRQWTGSAPAAFRAAASQLRT
ncbi:AraC family transcriptional regulator [Ramlibacter rhizophilus]|uniref:AraC family transcriptional regulator n=2 Tax=Ramlibacter rhizophilus TaxID=1781167 RepID=A0A4Z0BNL2_9BURK|nr:AraC family transcriptional regulator [Ramlibacter rhizophilus]